MLVFLVRYVCRLVVATCTYLLMYVCKEENSPSVFTWISCFSLSHVFIQFRHCSAQFSNFECLLSPTEYSRQNWAQLSWLLTEPTFSNNVVEHIGTEFFLKSCLDFGIILWWKFFIQFIKIGSFKKKIVKHKGIEIWTRFYEKTLP